MAVAIINYNAGNIYSVEHALHRLNVESVLTDDPAVIRQADKVIFPGQGEALRTMDYLRKHKMDTLIKSLKQPVLGICIGMQLMCRHSEEGDTDCLGIFDAEVKRFLPLKHEEKVPHMGWNNLTEVKAPLFTTVEENAYAYFVHSFYVPLSTDTVATTDYIQPFSAALYRDNFYATQFHPEKSGQVGEHILSNFLKL